MKRYFLVTLLAVFYIFCAAQTKSIQYSKPLSGASPEKVGMSTERLSRIDKMFEDAITTGQIPGAVALVARNGKIVYHKAFGMADNKAGKELEPDAIFRIASQTKAITATAVMMLWEEGLFKLDDPISRYIPEFSNEQVLDTMYEDGTYETVRAERKITIRHLLTHTSGIGYGMIDKDDRFKKMYASAGVTDLFTTKEISIGESVKKLARLPLHHHPGEKYYYSEGLDVLGYFIEIVSGMPLDEFFRTRIFNPLGMDDTWFYLPDSKHHRLVTVQTNNKGQGEWEPYPITFYDPAYPVKGAKAFFSGGAGLCSTAKDYATFLQMYLNGGELNGIRLLSRKTIETIMEKQAVGELNTGNNYRLVFGVAPEGVEARGGQGSEGTFGWGGYFNSKYFADPKEKTIGVILKQTRDIGKDGTTWKFKLLVNQAIDD